MQDWNPTSKRYSWDFSSAVFTSKFCSAAKCLRDKNLTHRVRRDADPECETSIPMVILKLPHCTKILTMSLKEQQQQVLGPLYTAQKVRFHRIPAQRMAHSRDRDDWRWGRCHGVHRARVPESTLPSTRSLKLGYCGHHDALQSLLRLWQE